MRRSKPVSEAQPTRSAAARALALALAALPLLAGCAHRASAPGAPAIGAAELARLRRPPAEGMAALYRLRVPSSGGLRLTLTSVGDELRVAIAEPFGSPLSLTAWRHGELVAFDLRRGCRLAAGAAADTLGVPALPVARVARLLAGRLPALAADTVELGDDGRVAIRGEDGVLTVELGAEPWRVTTVAEGDGSRPPAWRLELDDHTGSVPGAVHVATADGRRAELELARLEWGTVALPALPGELPPCVEVGR